MDKKDMISRLDKLALNWSEEKEELVERYQNISKYDKFYK